MRLLAPMYALVLMFETSIAPATFTAAVPATPALIPTIAKSSLFVAVTPTPRNPLVDEALIWRGPYALASPAGCMPDRTMLCDRPVPLLVRSARVEPGSPNFPFQSSNDGSASG